MKCNSIIVYYKKRTKTGKPRTYATIPFYYHKDSDYWEFFKENNDVSGLEWDSSNLCDGEIVATVEAVDEPYFGGTSAALNISYICNKCGGVYIDDSLPNEYNISDWLTNRIKEM